MNKTLRFSDVLRMMADLMDASEAQTIREIHDEYIRPLQQSRIFTNKEVAEHLHISPSQVSKLIRTGKLKTTADGRVTEYHLWQYLSSNEETILPNQVK